MNGWDEERAKEFGAHDDACESLIRWAREELTPDEYAFVYDKATDAEARAAHLHRMSNLDGLFDEPRARDRGHIEPGQVVIGPTGRKWDVVGIGLPPKAALCRMHGHDDGRIIAIEANRLAHLEEE